MALLRLALAFLLGFSSLSPAWAANKYQPIKSVKIQTGSFLLKPAAVSLKIPLARTGYSSASCPWPTGQGLAPAKISVPITAQAELPRQVFEKNLGRMAASAAHTLSQVGSGQDEGAQEAAQRQFDQGALNPSSAFPAAVPSDSESEAEPGVLTLQMLKKFIITGPPADARGEAYKLSQGAAVLPAELESSWANRAQKPLETGKDLRVARAVLLRRQERIFVRVGVNGRSQMLPVSPALAQGVTSDSLVEVAYDRSGVRDLRPVGSYPADMMVGRVVRQADKLYVAPLFSGENARALSLYAPLPIQGGVAAQEGTLVQAFVKPGARGFEAVPMLGLGREITPEIAAQEIALRHGARGYFEQSVIRQAEAEGRANDLGGATGRLKPHVAARDLTALDFITIDPVGAGDLDDAYHIEKQADGGFIWSLATANVAQFVRPETPAFRAAARIGNTFYSINKDGLSEFPMNHPVVSKYLASLLKGKDSPAMITRMHFDAQGKFLEEKTEIFPGVVHVKGRYSYDQVGALWKGEANHGVEHIAQVSGARELAEMLSRQDDKRGKLKISLDHVVYRKGEEGRWKTEIEQKDPLLEESHRLIEELKVYGNQGIARLLEEITAKYEVPHISRVHPAQDEKIELRLKVELASIGAPWANGTLADYLARLEARKDLKPEVMQVAQKLALMSRRSAIYTSKDTEGHEGLGLGAGQYDHPSAPIRRFSDMYNRALLEASLQGADPRLVYQGILGDLASLGFKDLEDYLQHLNGREQAAKQMDYEMADFMAVYELAKPENHGRPLSGYVKQTRSGRETVATIQLRGPPVTVTLRGAQAQELKLLDEVSVTISGADLARMRVDLTARKAGPVSTPGPTLGDRLGAVQADALRAIASAAPQEPVAPYVTDDEGVHISGRAADYYKQIKQLAEKLKDRIDLSESLSVMEDTYIDVWAKIKVIEAVAQSRNIERENAHLEETLTWVDGVVHDGDKKVPVHTYQVFFHHAKNRQSEIEEGIKRVDHYLKEQIAYFAEGGRAEQELGGFDEAVLAFNTRGHKEIKDHIKARALEIFKIHGNRYHFVYLDEIAEVPETAAALHEELNLMKDLYHGKGLEKIYDGIIYGRFVGLLLELQTVEYFLDQKYEILQSGRELFDGEGKYITELDTVVRAPDGKVSVVEAKSARVKLPFEEVLANKVLKKLDTYSKHRAELEAAIGSKFDQVIFAFDVGPLSGRKRSVSDHRELANNLRRQEKILSAKYGFPVRFIFLGSSDPKNKRGR